MTVPAWLACGALAAALAWSAQPQRYPGGPLSALAAGLSGGFLGGAFVILIAGRHGALLPFSVYGAAVGATVLLDLSERTSTPGQESPGAGTLAWLWSWALLLDPVLLAILIGATTGSALHSPLLGTLASLASILLIAWQRHHGAPLLRRWRR